MGSTRVRGSGTRRREATRRARSTKIAKGAWNTEAQSDAKNAKHEDREGCLEHGGAKRREEREARRSRRVSGTRRREATRRTRSTKIAKGAWNTEARSDAKDAPPWTTHGAGEHEEREGAVRGATLCGLRACAFFVNFVLPCSKRPDADCRARDPGECTPCALCRGVPHRSWRGGTR